MNVKDLFSIDGKTALITGGSRGIGLMLARAFVDAGAKVIISSRKADACQAVVDELGPSCSAVPADLSTLDGVRALAAAVREREPKLHVLINNAGATWGAPLAEFPEAGFDKVLDTNVKGVYYLTVELLEQLKAAASDDDPARVINIGSIDGLRVPEMTNYPYSASKAAVHMLTRHLAHHLVGERITVNAIAPGLFPSKMTQFLFDAGGEENVAQFIPMKRVGRAEDIAGTAIYLSSRAGAFLTGAIIPVDGGVATR
jgi:NAD(P)-dependent dehydrogenase (short-subunit alcohol dehydrogenase family)